MSIRENIEVYYALDPEELLGLLVSDYGARAHPKQADSFLVGDPELPFYKPRQSDDHISVLGFNYAPLPSLILQALIDHPELIPDNARICWTAEQDLILEGYLGDLRSQAEKRRVSGE